MLLGEDLKEKLMNYIINVANGEQTCNEKNGYRKIAIFKDGVTL
jgi:altronate hydrolase